MYCDQVLESPKAFEKFYAFCQRQPISNFRECSWPSLLEFTQLVRELNPGLGAVARSFFPANLTTARERTHYIYSRINTLEDDLTPMVMNDITQRLYSDKLDQRSFNYAYCRAIEGLRRDAWPVFATSQEGRAIGATSRDHTPRSVVDQYSNEVNDVMYKAFAQKVDESNAPQVGSAPLSADSKYNAAKFVSDKGTQPPPMISAYNPDAGISDLKYLTEEGLTNLYNQLNPTVAAPVTRQDSQLLLQEQTREQLQNNVAVRQSAAAATAAALGANFAVSESKHAVRQVLAPPVVVAAPTHAHARHPRHIRFVNASVPNAEPVQTRTGVQAIYRRLGRSVPSATSSSAATRTVQHFQIHPKK